MKIRVRSETARNDLSVQFDDTRSDARLIERPEGPVLSLGIKDELPYDRRKLLTLVRRVVGAAKVHRLKHVALALDALPHELPRADLLRIIGENAHLADYAFIRYKAEPTDGWPFLETLTLVGDVSKEEEAALRHGELVAAHVNACRDLANVPGGDMTPAFLAREVTRAARGTGANVTVLGVTDMTKRKMGAILGVARGAKETPHFIIVEYWGAGKKHAPIVLVGKGVTFDTGGLSLKPADYMLDMHLDMSGGAAVAYAVIAAARLKLNVNAVALIPAVENAISGESYRPGDVLRSMSGKTIDILNTDAEGRVILADALTYAQRYEPKLVVDVATLTGAALVALGTKASAVMSKDPELATLLTELGEVSGDYCWPLPLWDEYKEMVKGRFGDVANIPTENARYAGTIGGGMFLAEFAEGYRWAHIDIAPRMVSDKGDHLTAGAAGAPVRLLVRLLEGDTP
jgi:leucyl aminopeptidase